MTEKLDSRLISGGEMGMLIREKNWADTPLGPIEEWPDSLCNIVNALLQTKFPVIIYWGEELTAIYNDAYRPLLGDKPEALGRPFHTIWTEVLDIIGPLADKTLAGEVCYFNNRELTLMRYGKPEQAWFDFCYSPLRDETGAVAGILNISVEKTRQIEVEQSLRKSEERYRTLFESIHEGFAIIEVLFDDNNKPDDYRFLEVNPAFEKQTGIKNAEGKRMRQIAPDHENHWFEIYGRVALTREPVRFENSAKALDRFYDGFAFPFGEPDSRKVAVLFKDITGRRQAEKNLRSSEKRFRTMMEQSPLSMQIFDAEGGTLEVNPAWERLWGTSREELKGYNILKDEQLKESGLITQIQSAFDGEVVKLPATYYDPAKIGKPGRPRWIEGYIYPLVSRDGKIQEVALVHHDITDRKETEKKLFETREQLQMATRAASVGTWTWDIRENIVTADAYLAESYGMDPDTAAVGAPMEAFYETIHEEDEKETWAQLMRAVEETGELEVEYRVRDANDKTRWILARGEVEYENGEAAWMHGAVSDITERKQAEEKLIESEARLSAIFDTTPECIKIVAADGTLLQMNPSGLSMVGAKSASNVVGKSVYNLIAPEYREEFQEFNERICRGESGTFQFDIIGLRGTRRHMETHAAPLQNSDGAAAQLALTRDITERKQAEEALRESKEHFQLAVEVAGIGTWHYDINTDLVHLDERMCEIWGESRATIPLPELVERIHPDDRERVIQAINAALDPQSGVSYSIEYRIIWDDSTVHWISANGQAQFTGEGENRKAVHFFGTALDITERKQREIRDQFLAQLSGTLQQISNPDEIMTTTAQLLGKHLEADRCAYAEVDKKGTHFVVTGDYTRGDTASLEGRWDIAEFSAESLMMMRRNQVHVVDDIDADEHITGEAKAAYKQIMVRAMISVPLHKDGQFVAGMTVHQQAPRRWLPEEIELVERVTNRCWEAIERARVTRELQKMNETLEERVEKRTRALKIYQDQLRSLTFQLNKAEEQERHRLAAVLHDNLGQVLAVTKMKLQNLKKANLPDNTANEIDDLTALTNDALSYTRELMSDLKPPPTINKEDVREVLRWVAQKMEKYDLEVTIEDDRKPKPLSKEIQTTLYQCVREFLFNVVKHANVNEARLVVSRDENTVQITVEDEGSGFDMKEQKPAPTEEGGFGLFNIYERMYLLGGSLDIASERGKGTKVTLSVPMNDDYKLDVAIDGDGEAGKPSYKSEKQTKQQEKVRILLVDDHEMMRRGLRKIIEEQPDFTIIAEASDGSEAVKLARETSPDVIVMDINMPVMDGIEATRQIAADVPGTRIIGLSLHDQKEVARDMLNAGASAYLIKTQAFETLCTTIRNEAQTDGE